MPITGWKVVGTKNYLMRLTFENDTVTEGDLSLTFAPTISTTVSYVAGKVGQAGSILGGGSLDWYQYEEGGSDSIPKIVGNDKTIAFWAKMPGTYTYSPSFRIEVYEDIFVPPDDYTWHHVLVEASSSDGMITFEYMMDGYTYSNVFHFVDMRDDAWHHYAISFNNSTEVITCYVDGVAVGTMPFYPNDQTLEYSNINIDTASLTATSFDEFTVFNTPMAQTQVAEEMARRVPSGSLVRAGREKAVDGSSLSMPIAKWRVKKTSAPTPVSEFQPWEGYPDSPDLLSAYPYQFIFSTADVKLITSSYPMYVLVSGSNYAIWAKGDIRIRTYAAGAWSSPSSWTEPSYYDIFTTTPGPISGIEANTDIYSGTTLTAVYFAKTTPELSPSVFVEPDTSDLFFYYKFDRTTTDGGPFGLDLNVLPANSFRYDEGKQGAAFCKVSSSNQAVRYLSQSIPAENFTKSLCGYNATVCFWLKSMGAGNEILYYRERQTGTEEPEFSTNRFFVDSNDDGTLWISSEINGEWYDFYGVLGGADGEWHFVALIWDADNLLFSAMVDDTKLSQPFVPYNFTSANLYELVFEYGTAFETRIDEYHQYSRVLSDAELYALSHDTSGVSTTLVRLQ